MSIYVVSDLHGAPDALGKAVPEGATLLLLGDLLNVIDYAEMSGILVEIFSADAVGEVVQLRKDGDLDEAMRVIQQRAKGREEEIRAEFARLAAIQYEAIFSVLPGPTYMILGNVDIPPMASAFAGQSDGRVIEANGRAYTLGGERFGFVGGALPTPLKVAGEVTVEEMRSKLDAIGEVDVLCTHIPPAVPELCYDTLAEKPERGSEDLLAYIQDVQPRVHYFGHVHQPLVSSLHIGRTLCINVGYFRATKRAWHHASA
jgi:Icc-related predicted phosphoesterase